MGHAHWCGVRGHPARWRADTYGIYGTAVGTLVDRWYSTVGENHLLTLVGVRSCMALQLAVGPQSYSRDLWA